MTISLDSTAPSDEDVYCFPASFGQRRLWVLDQLEPGSPVYNIFRSIRLTGPLHVAALEQSLAEIVRRHKSLRTTVTTVEGQPMQVIAPTLTLPLPCVDLQDLPEGVRAERAALLAATEARQPFVLARGPLLRTTLLQLGAQEHLLLVTIHHIVADGWSMGVLLRELARLYSAHVRGTPAALPELPIQYADYSLWQQEWLQGEVLEAHLAYWREQLAGAPAVLELPSDRPRPPVQSFRGTTHGFVLPLVLSQALRQLSQQEGVTLFMTLLAAFQVLLARYTGQDDIVVGSPIAGRTRTELEDLIGFFVNTLVLRTDFGGDPTFRALLGRVREVTLEAYAHQDVPFERLVEELQPQRDLSCNPLFQVMFVLRNTPRWTEECAGLTMEEVREVDTGTTTLDLTLYLEETEQGLAGECRYSTDLFEAATIARLIGHWQTLLEGIVADPGQRLSQLPLLSEAERQEILVAWNATQTDYRQDCCIHELFEEQVECAPDAVAVVCGDEQLSYRELNQRANQLAHHLQQLGVGPEVRVGLCVERSLGLVVGLLAILKAGGAYVPLDPAYPSARLAFMLEDARVAVLLSQERLREQLPRQAIPLVCLDSDGEAIAQQRVADVCSQVTPENLAYVIYTSGSTGQPRGVLVSHRNLVHSTDARVAYYREPVRNFLLLSSFAFDSSVAGIFWTLCQGGTLWLPTETLQCDVSQLAAFIARNHISHTLSVPSLYAHLLAEAEPPQLESLGTVIVGGESCSRDLVLSHRERRPTASLFNEYGPTEATVWSTVYACLSPSVPTSIPIGRPIANTQVYILDRHLQPVPVGVPGELHIGGAGVARGYLNRPDLTAEKFIANPFSPEPRAPLYRTGDLVRYLPDGNIEFLGRLDNQVTIRGFRIELGEIEAVLLQHPAVHEAVVAMREDTPGDQRLVAYVVPPPDAPLPSADALRQYLQQHLPAYMVPAALVPLDALPLTPSGKVDRRALPLPDQSRAAQGALVAPRTPVEDLLAAIWADVLQVERVGVYDNFFELGGHSLLALRVVHRIEQVWGKKMALATLFAGPTIAQLAQTLLEARDDESGVRTAVVPLHTGGSRRPFFFLHGHYLGTAYYCLPLARALGPDQPFYALDPYRLDDLAVPPTLEEIAATHLEALCAIQPAGPYLLGGFCNGGLVAYEMARQLHAAGQTVDLLVLMDPMPLPQDSRLVYRALHGLLALVRLSPAQQVAWFVRLHHLVQHLYNHLRGHGGDEADLPVPALTSLVLTDDALHHAYPGLLHWSVLAYRPPSVYPGKVTFFWPANEPWHARWWRPVAEATAVEEHLLPGTQNTWKTDHLPALSECLRLCLDKAHAAVKAPVAGGHMVTCG